MNSMVMTMSKRFIIVETKEKNGRYSIFIDKVLIYQDMDNYLNYQLKDILQPLSISFTYHKENILLTTSTTYKINRRANYKISKILDSLVNNNDIILIEALRGVTNE